MSMPAIVHDGRSACKLRRSLCEVDMTQSLRAAAGNGSGLCTSLSGQCKPQHDKRETSHTSEWTLVTATQLLWW